jgi:hypothetical protein
LCTISLLLLVGCVRGFYEKLGKRPWIPALIIMVAEFFGILMSLITVGETATKEYGTEKQREWAGLFQGIVV